MLFTKESDMKSGPDHGRIQDYGGLSSCIPTCVIKWPLPICRFMFPSFMFWLWKEWWNRKKASVGLPATWVDAEWRRQNRPPVAHRSTMGSVNSKHRLFHSLSLQTFHWSECSFTESGTYKLLSVICCFSIPIFQNADQFSFFSISISVISC